MLDKLSSDSRRIFYGLIPLFLFLCLFPYGWLAEQSPLFDRFASFLFGTELAHVIGHSILYGGITAVLLTVRPQLLQHPKVYLGAIVLIGIGQEALQILSYKQRPIVFNDIFDVMVNTTAATAVFFFLRARQQKEIIG